MCACVCAVGVCAGVCVGLMCVRGVRIACVCAAKCVLRRRRVCERQVDIRVCERACVWLCVLRVCCGNLVVMAANGGRWDAACGLACVDDDRR